MSDKFMYSTEYAGGKPPPYLKKLSDARDGLLRELQDAIPNATFAVRAIDALIQAHVELYAYQHPQNHNF
jgi:hypothetical protein